MKKITMTAVLLGALVSAGRGAEQPPDIKRDGAFAFPQSQAKVFCDEKDLRLSVWNDAKHLYVQAVLWTDGADSVEKTKAGKPVWGWSQLCLDVDADQKRTPNVDRHYSLNPLLSFQGLPFRGLRYSVVVSDRLYTPLKSDSKGRGAIRYLDVGKGQLVRVDSYAIPLAEIGKKSGEKIRLAYWAQCPKPERKLNSIGDTSKNGAYAAWWLPLNMYHEITLAKRAASLDVSQVPEGREDKAPPRTNPRKPVRNAGKPILKVGAAPPEVSAKDWINTDEAPTLAGLKGKVVLVEFWYSRTSACIRVIPQLNKLHEKYRGKGLTILGFTPESAQEIEKFRKRTPLKYVIGTSSGLRSEYGVSRMPHAFLIGKDGNLLWEGDPADKELDQRVRAAVKSK